MTDQATQKRYVRLQLENMWKRYNAQLRLEDHELVVLAVPTYPANIEAVSALDLSDINDLMAVFAKHREENPDELQQIEPASGPPQGQTSEAREHGRGEEAIPDDHGLGTRHDGRGAPQERAEPAPEPNEGDAAPDAMELMQPPYERIPMDKLAYHFGVTIEKALAAQDHIGYMYRQRATVPLEDISLVDRLMKQVRDVMGGARQKEPTTPMWLREQRIADAVKTGVECKPRPGFLTGCEICGAGPCTGMYPRPSDHNEP